MIIRKLYEFENAHIVRLCGSKRCRTSIHGHSYRCEILLSSNFLDEAGMVYDFGYMKLGIRELIDSFDGEREVKLHSVIVHETVTGYAQCFREDAYNAQMGEIALEEIEFSPAVREEWRQPELWQKLLRGEKIIYPKDC